MSEMKSEDPWFIARDGAQHGPLNESEMQLFVERGHLRTTDLVWRQGFPDWRPAFSVFPPKTPQSQPPQPTAPPQASTVSAQSPAPGPSGHATPARAPIGSPSQQAAAPSTPHASTLGAATPSPAPQTTEAGDFYDEGAESEHRSGWGRALLSTVVIGAITGVGIWFYLNGPPAIFDQAGSGSGAVPIVRAPQSSDATQEQPKIALTTTQRINIDKRLQNAELWQFLKNQYPAWYGNVLKNADGLDQSDNFERKLSELLISRLIELRRRNAKKVLASSSQSLTKVASTFLDNLKELAGRGPEPCFTFISKGEASPAVIEAMRKPGDSAAIHGQLLATFQASVDGANAPVTRAAPQKSDYEALTSQLAKIGWNKEDIQLFANPKALSQAPPARVCQMVQDWFTAHLNLENAETQERLLYETLRPVVSG